MNITIWRDDEILEGKWLERSKKMTNRTANSTSIDNLTRIHIELTKIHHVRQPTFFRKCAKHLQQQNRTWTTFHDVDEYLAFDHCTLGKENSTRLMNQPGSILRFLNHVREAQPNNTLFQRPCISVPRVLFGAEESSQEEIQKDVPHFVDPMPLYTLRFRHHARHNNDKANGPVKGLVDLSLVPKDWRHFSVHRHIGSLCGKYNQVSEHQLNFHHYVGTWEAYNDDACGRNKEKWLAKATQSSMKDNDAARPWIQGVVDWLGDKLSQLLLQYELIFLEINHACHRNVHTGRKFLNFIV